MNDLNELRHLMPFLIPLVAIVMGIGIGMFALWIDYQKKREIFELHHKERLLAIERGMEVPPLPDALLTSTRYIRTRTRQDHLRIGLIYLLAGLAVVAALGMNQDWRLAAWGLIPVAIGLAQLIYCWLTPEGGGQPTR